MPKTVFEYEGGIEMNSIESIEFQFWLDKQDFYMNTLEKHERIKVITDWLEKYRTTKQSSL
jgi:hypothetical protein